MNYALVTSNSDNRRRLINLDQVEQIIETTSGNATIRFAEASSGLVVTETFDELVRRTHSPSAVVSTINNSFPELTGVTIGIFHGDIEMTLTDIQFDITSHPYAYHAKVEGITVTGLTFEEMMTMAASVCTLQRSIESVKRLTKVTPEEVEELHASINAHPAGRKVDLIASCPHADPHRYCQVCVEDCPLGFPQPAKAANG
jgi:predicted HAD superfamily phosphohydrolase